MRYLSTESANAHTSNGSNSMRVAVKTTVANVCALAGANNTNAKRKNMKKAVGREEYANHS